MATSKFIFVMAVPSTENQAMLSRELLELIQPNAVLILASRAHVIDFDAATEMVLAGRFKLATDVFPGLSRCRPITRFAPPKAPSCPRIAPAR